MDHYEAIAGPALSKGRLAAILAIGVILSAVSPAAASSQYLLYIPGSVGYSGGNDLMAGNFTYELFYFDMATWSPMPPAFPVRYGELAVAIPAEFGADLPQGAAYTLNAANTPTFPEFAALATNGQADDTLVNGMEDPSGGGWHLTTENGWGWSSSTSYRLDEVRLEIDYLNILPNRTSYETRYHWEFWGQTVPEPGACTAVMATLCSAVMSRRRRMGPRT